MLPLLINTLDFLNPKVEWRRQTLTLLLIRFKEDFPLGKYKLLSKARRLTHIKSVLNSIPTYHMQIAWLPQSICSQIDKLTRNFVWKGVDDKGLNLIGFQTITKQKSYGGLCVHLSREANTTMLGKLVWDIHSGSDKLWVKLLKDKYIIDDSFFCAPKKYGSPVWNSIYKAKEVLRNGNTFMLGNGAFSFCYSSWTSFSKLSGHVAYVDIHDIDLCIKDVIQQGTWNLEVLYTAFPQYITDYVKVVHIFLHPDIEDTIIWKENFMGTYSAKAGYN